MTTFDEFFEQATGRGPYPYQRRLGEESDLPPLLQAPTGAGKTYAVGGAWLYRRRFHPDLAVRRATPRRLVYCLPMRTLVEQTRKVLADMVGRLGLDGDDRPVRVASLLGGEHDDTRWELYPEDDAILVGTQDMLLSRALNRGYALSRFAWPIPFGLLNNDSLWVLDEVQLMANGLATTAQLDGFRAALGTFGPAASVWMSATIDPAWLKTYDSRIRPDLPPFGLGEEDRRQPDLAQRLRAPKTLRRLPLDRGLRGPERARDIAGAIGSVHIPGTLTLVVVNTVAMAQAVYDRLSRGKVETVLIHSRFRPAERRANLERLVAADPGELIAVSTQVVEAGVDVSARTLLTDLAPWASLVQRFGRCNRKGEYDEASVWWADLDEEHAAAPYDADLLKRARTQLEELEGRSVSPDGLAPATEGPETDYLLRWRDLMDLFDTTPDLGGADVDVSRFVRGTDETDVQLFWRDLDAAGPADDLPRPVRDELCPAPIGEVRGFLEKLAKSGKRAYRWDHIGDGRKGRWDSVSSGDVRPGDVLLIPATAGGYDPGRGWLPTADQRVEPVEINEVKRPPDATGEDAGSESPSELTLAAHTDDVAAELEGILAGLDMADLEADELTSLRLAARYHDAGKGHVVMQTTLRGRKPEPGEPILAKSPRRGRHERRFFRHELASALAFVKAGPPEGGDLAAYLIAAHHGKVRLAIRTGPGEEPLVDGKRRALGIQDGDGLPGAELGGGVALPAVTLDLEMAWMGRGSDGTRSWLDRAAGLRDRLGPFRLAYLEALVRAADMRASAKEGGRL